MANYGTNKICEAAHILVATNGKRAGLVDAWECGLMHVLEKDVSPHIWEQLSVFKSEISTFSPTKHHSQVFYCIQSMHHTKLNVIRRNIVDWAIELGNL
ncbi:MAG: hypothetical protein COB16_15955 [Rhodobacteraceae bacterium]|nr:MAG: hypothetical protein COB16_15955 [Paracoccaceae bacterium]